MDDDFMIIGSRIFACTTVQPIYRSQHLLYRCIAAVWRIQCMRHTKLHSQVFVCSLGFILVFLTFCLHQFSFLVSFFSFLCSHRPLTTRFLPRDSIQCKALSCDRMLPVCLSVTFVDCESRRFEILETNCTDTQPNIFALVARPKTIHLFPEEHGEILGRLDY